jgi:hypothetical protein
LPHCNEAHVPTSVWALWAQSQWFMNTLALPQSAWLLGGPQEALLELDKRPWSTNGETTFKHTKLPTSSTLLWHNSIHVFWDDEMQVKPGSLSPCLAGFRSATQTLLLQSCKGKSWGSAEKSEKREEWQSDMARPRKEGERTLQGAEHVIILKTTVRWRTMIFLERWDREARGSWGPWTKTTHF